MSTSIDSFGAKGTLEVGENSYEIFRLSAVPGTEKLPYSLKVLAENLLRTEDGANITADHIRAIASWDPSAEPSIEIQFTPARVIMQDFTGVPCVVDLATMREAMADPRRRRDQDQPALHRPKWSSTTRSSLDVFGTARCFRAQCRDRVRAQPRALPVPALGTRRIRRLQGRPAREPASCTRSTSRSWRAPWCSTSNGTGVPRFLRRNRLAHHDGQRPGRRLAGASAASRLRQRCSASPISMLIPRVVGFKLSGEIKPQACQRD